MRKQLLLIITMSLILLAAACGTSSSGESKVGGDETVIFQATILEIQDGYYLVEPEVGDVLEIEYDGSIAESYPAQITKVYSIRVAE